MKKYIIVGVAGHGKSTIANALFNADGSTESLSQPFPVSDGALLCTKHHQVADNEENDSSVLDTAGFGCLETDVAAVLEDIRQGIVTQFDGSIHGVIYVIKLERFSIETLTFTRLLVYNFFGDRFRDNSIVVFTHADQRKLVQGLNGSAEFMREIVSQCDGRCIAIDLRPDAGDDDETDRAKNRVKRTKMVQELVNFVRSQDLPEIKFSKM